MTPALAALLKDMESPFSSDSWHKSVAPRLVAIVREMDEDRERLAAWMPRGRTSGLSEQTTARIDALARGEDAS